MLRSLKGFMLLDGYRGARRADVAAAARAIAHSVADDQLNASYIVPSVFDSAVAPAVAAAVRACRLVP